MPDLQLCPSIEQWTKGDMKNETLIFNEAKRQNEPFALWPRKARAIFISEIAALPLQDLYALEDDMRIQIAELNGIITAELGKLALISENQPMVINATKFAIKKMTKKKASIKLIMVEAMRLRKLLNREACKPKPKLEKIISRQLDHDSLTDLDKKMQYFKRKELFLLFRAEIGDTKTKELEELAWQKAIPSFEEWAANSGAKAELAQHVLKNAIKFLSITTTPSDSHA